MNTPCNTNNEPSRKAMVLKTLVRINSDPLKRITPKAAARVSASSHVVAMLPLLVIRFAHNSPLYGLRSANSYIFLTYSLPLMSRA
jgi:hypothetical protein